MICDAIRSERDVEIALSPRVSLGYDAALPGQDITIDDMYTQTSMNYPAVYRMEFTGKQLKTFWKMSVTTFSTRSVFQQGGDMVRVGGMSYRCAPKAEMGSRISEMVLNRTGNADRRGDEIYGWWLGIDQPRYRRAGDL